MANSKTIWRGSGSATLTITQIQTDTAKNRHISSYAFYCDTADLNGNILDASTNTTSITGDARVNKTKDYTITSYLIYSHKFGNGSTTATSNKVNSTITVHEPLNKESLNRISLNKTWVWSNASDTSFTITPVFDTLSPFSYEGQYISDSTTAGEPKGSIQSSGVGNITTSPINTLTWKKSTGSTNLGAQYKNITISVKSTTNSAPSAVEIPDRTVTIQVRNAVLSLSGLSNDTTYGKATTKITQTVTFNPSTPFSTELKLVDKNGTDIQGNTISKDGSVLKLEGTQITLDASKSTNYANPTEFSFKVRSYQSAEAKDTQLITFIVKPVKNINDVIVIEGQTFTIQDAGIGVITHASVDRGPIEVVGTNGTSIELKGKAVDRDDDWLVTIKNAQGTVIKIQGRTQALEDITVNINSGDYIVLGSATFGNTLGKVAAVEKVKAGDPGTASVVNQEFKFEAYNTTGVIAAGKYPIKVTGTNGATQIVQVVVTDIAVTVE